MTPAGRKRYEGKGRKESTSRATRRRGSTKSIKKKRTKGIELNKLFYLIGIPLAIVLVGSLISYLIIGRSTSPAITSFSASPQIIDKGELTTLAWDVSNATSVDIQPEIGDVPLTGTRSVRPDENVTFILTATNKSDSVQATAQVFVSGPPPETLPPVINSLPTPLPGPQPPPTPEPEPKGKEYVWYAGYGSNLCRERFLCYIKGGQYKLGGSYAQGCDDKTLPQENKTIELPYRLYFALESSSWGQGGVAFVSVDKEEDQEKWTLARMWKITEEQFEQVRQQEGISWYNHIIDLGIDEGIPILTITNSMKQTLNPPSKNYLSTIVIGLMESYQLDADEVYHYLYQKEGIQGYFSEKELRDIIEQGFNAGR